MPDFLSFGGMIAFLLIALSSLGVFFLLRSRDD